MFSRGSLLVLTPFLAAATFAQQAPKAATTEQPPVPDYSGPILSMIPALLHMLFVKLWFCWPIIIGVTLLQRWMNGPRRTRRR